jgi:hypothetical protein
MSKQKSKKVVVQHSVIHPTAEKVGAIVLTVLSVLVSFEAIIEHNPKFSRVHHGDDNKPAISELFARGESKGETARLPEEFDIGLQTPHVSGL